MSSPITLSTPLAFALAYVAIGWHVLPLEPNAKIPLGRLVPRGMLDATVDQTIVQRWWKTAPSAGIGIALAPSGLVAIDVDPRNGGSETFDQLQSDHGSLRSEVMAFTGGGGEHHVFVVPPGVQISLPGTLGAGVDLKANGYIVVEPSIHPSGKQYVWEASSSPLEGVAPSPLPDWLRNLRPPRSEAPVLVATAPMDAARAREAREALYMLDVDDRDTWLRAGMALHSTGWGGPAYAMWCAWSQQSGKFNAVDQRRVWESFTDPGRRQDALGIGWLFTRAREAGWVKPPAAPAPPGLQPGEERRELPMLSPNELREQASAITWVVKHAIPSESVGIIFGGSGTFKSFIALDLALHVAHGLTWLGRRTAEGPVIYIAAEGGAGLWRRIEAWHLARRMKWDGIPIYVVPVAVDLMHDAVLVTDAAKRVGITPALVIVDTMSQTFSGEENSSTEVAAYLRELGLMFRATWQCAVLVVHHSGHQATERPRGSSALRANVDFMFGVFRDEQEMLATVECIKQKDGERFSEVSFALKEWELGKDSDGDAIKTLVASRLVDSAEVLETMAAEGAQGRKGRNQLLIELAEDGQEEKALRAAFYEAAGDLETPEARRKAFYRSMQWAARNGFLCSKAGRIQVLRNLESGT